MQFLSPVSLKLRPAARAFPTAATATKPQPQPCGIFFFAKNRGEEDNGDGRLRRVAIIIRRKGNDHENRLRKNYREMKFFISPPLALMVTLLMHYHVSAFLIPQQSVMGPSARPPPMIQNPFHQHSNTQFTKLLSPPSSSVVTTSTSTTALLGIPKMFRWLTDQYPNILNRRLGSATSIPPIDNFYLDMNGIIHPCTHGNNEDEITILHETEMFKKIFGYVDRLYKIVQPKRVLYLAVDGVSRDSIIHFSSM